MSSSINVKIAGEWKTATNAYQKINGEWKTITSISPKINDEYKTVYIGRYSEGLAYTLNDDSSYSVRGIGTCTDTFINIPPTYKELPVTGISGDAFEGSDITYVRIPEGVTSIGSYAFLNCRKLKKATIPRGIADIGYSAFSGCSSLTSITIPNSIAKISNYAFASCASLKSVVFEAGSQITQFYKNTFQGCKSLEHMTLPFVGTHKDGSGSNLTHFGGIFGAEGYEDNENYVPSSLKTLVITGGASIGYYAFYRCINLENITITGNLARISDRAFYNCSGIKGITLPDSVTSIGKNAFSGCTSLASITIGNGVTSIGDYAFSSCTSLASITIGNGVTSIGDYAFSSCKSLESIIIGNGVTSIGDYAFSSCKSLESIIIPDSVTSIGESVFWNCTSLASIITPFFGPTKDSEPYDTFFGYMFGGVGNYGETNSDVPQSLKIVEITGEIELGWYAFSDCSGIEHIIFRNNITEIPSSAFMYCSSLKSITIPGDFTRIGYEAFYGCSSLTDIIIPNGVTSIDQDAFEGCTMLSNVYYAGTLEGWMNISFSSRNSNPLHCGGRLYIYNDEDIWDMDEIGGTIVIPNSITSIGYCFSGCLGILGVTIHDNVTSIGDSAFENCRNLKSITIPESITCINDRTFYGCTYLKDVTIPNSVTTIGKDVFSECLYLESITIPNSVESIGFAAFSRCRWLDNITLPFVGATKNDTANTHFGYIFGASSYEDNSSYVPTRLKTVEITGSIDINDYMFYECDSIETVTIGDGTTDIGKYAFQWCSKLTNITLPNSIVSIDYGAFDACENLDKVYYKGELAGWMNITFSGDDSNPMYYANELYFNGNIVKDIVIPNNITRIKPYTFISFTSLESVTFEENSRLNTITVEAFRDCKNLKSIMLPDSVTSISSNAFENCQNLENVVISNNINYIGYKAFYNCPNIAYNEHSNAYYLGNNDNPYVALIMAKDEAITSCTVNDSTLIIAGAAFLNCSSLEEIIISDSVINICDRIFEGCTSLETMTVGENNSAYRSEGNCIILKSTNDLVFGCKGSKIPGSVTNIKYTAFYGCIGLIDITIPNSVTSIEGLTFGGCSNLASITLPFIGNKSSNATYSNFGYIFGASGDNRSVPASIKTVKITGGTTIAERAFSDCGKIKSITLPYGITSIGRSAFDACSSLTNINIPDSVTDVGIQAFYGCSSLERISIPNSVTSIGSFAFYNCSNLESMVIPNKVTSIDDYTFYNCSILASITIPTSVTSIGDRAFGSCGGLTAVYYAGNKSQWDAITIGDGNDVLYAINIICN